MNDSGRFASGMLVNCLLIIAGVGFLLWVSTFGDNDIRSKMEFYGSKMGQMAIMVLFLIPFFFVASLISSRRVSTTRGLVKVIAVMFAVQIFIAAFAPNVIALGASAGSDAAEAVIKAKQS